MIASEVTTEIQDLILDPSEAMPNTVLKKQLIRRTAASEQHGLQQLFNSEELGDRKPAQLLSGIQQLLGDQASARAVSPAFTTECTNGTSVN